MKFRQLGRPVDADLGLDVSALSGITLYEPEELVLSARAGTPLAEIETLKVGVATDPAPFGVYTTCSEIESWASPAVRDRPR